MKFTFLSALAVAGILFVGNVFATTTLVLPVPAPVQLDAYVFTYSSDDLSATYWEITVNGNVVSPANYMNLSFSYLVLCSDTTTLTITVQALDNTSTPIVGETATSTSPAIVYSSNCPVATATFVGAASDTIPVLSTQTVSVSSALTLGQVQVFLGGVFLCQVASVPAGGSSTCTGIIPCSVLGTNVPLELSAKYPSGVTTPAPPLTYWNVDFVAGKCQAQLIALNVVGSPPSIAAANCIQFGLQLDPTDDPTLYYNIAVNAQIAGNITPLMYTDILNACTLDFSLDAGAITEANQSSWLIGSWKIPCWINDAGVIPFTAVYSRKTIGSAYQQTLSSSVSVNITENRICEVVFPYPTVTRPPCTGPTLVEDSNGDYLQMLLPNDVLNFSIKIGDDEAYTYDQFSIDILQNGNPLVPPVNVFTQVDQFTLNSCNIFAAGTFTIPSSLQGLTGLQAVLNYVRTPAGGGGAVNQTITLCFYVLPAVTA